MTTICSLFNITLKIVLPQGVGKTDPYVGQDGPLSFCKMVDTISTDTYDRMMHDVFGNTFSDVYTPHNRHRVEIEDSAPLSF